MSANDDHSAASPSPFSRPGWVVAAVVVGAVLVVGVVLSVMALIPPKSESPTNPSAPTLTEAPEPTGTPTGDTESSCGLDETQMTGTLDSSPQITWAFAGTTAFPVSERYGPGAVTEGDIRTCFTRTPEGAALAASVGMGYMLDPESVQAWREYALAPGAVRDEVLATPVTGAPSSTRIQVTSFRLLAYDGDTARVDVGVTLAGDGETGYMSSVLPLVWINGDWRVDFPASAFTEAPAQLPNLAGYVHWKE